MSEIISILWELLLALIEGVLFGVLFYAGLWWTVRRLASVKQVTLLFLGSLLLRTIVVMLGFYFMLGDSWQHLLAGLTGFVIARFIVIRLTRPADILTTSVMADNS